MNDQPHAVDEHPQCARNVGLVAAIGVGAFLVYRSLSRRRPRRDHGQQVREGLQSVKERVDHLLAEGVASYMDSSAGPADDAIVIDRAHYAQDELPGYGEGRDPQGRGRQPAPQPDYDLSPVT